MGINEELFERAAKSIPGGVNSPVRAFRSVGGAPRFIRRAQGAYMWDAEGRRFIDYIGSWGPMILGHNHPAVIEAVEKAVANGLSFGAVTEGETLLAEEILKIMPNCEQVRLVKAGSGMLTFGNPSSAGVPASFTEHTIVLEYNNPEALEACFKAHGDDIACVIVEAVAGNMNMVPATQEFIDTMRSLCTKYGALMIVDEVMTGFRVALQGAQSVYHVRPDITMFGKVIGGGMPVAAFAASRDIMKTIAPEGPVYQAGTLSGNPVAVACGLATLKEIQKPGFYDVLSAKTKRLTEGLTAAAKDAGVDFCARSLGGMMGLFFLPVLPNGFSDVMKADAAVFGKFFHEMLNRGVYLAPSIYEAGFMSAAHTDEDIDATIAAAREAFALL